MGMGGEGREIKMRPVHFDALNPPFVFLPHWDSQFPTFNLGPQWLSRHESNSHEGDRGRRHLSGGLGTKIFGKQKYPML